MSSRNLFLICHLAEKVAIMELKLSEIITVFILLMKELIRLEHVTDIACLSMVILLMKN